MHGGWLLLLLPILCTAISEDQTESKLCILSRGLWICPATGICINRTSLCDGWNDCKFGEDEYSCDNDKYIPCNLGDVLCGLTKICVSQTKHCNGIQDCPGGEDEIGCPRSPSINCPGGQFSCDGLCKPLFMMCNDKSDCFDGSDERGELCSKWKPYYQVSGIGVKIDQRFFDRFQLEWWIEGIPQGLYLPSVMDLVSMKQYNATNWLPYNNVTVGLGQMPIKLRPFKRYSVTIFVKVGTSEYLPGIWRNVTTPPTVPGKPYDVSAVQKDTNSVIVAWKRPIFMNDFHLGYCVIREPPMPELIRNFYSCTWDNEELEFTNGEDEELPLFVDGETYSFRVVAASSANHSEPSDPFSFVYIGAVAKILGNPSVIGVQDYQATISWNCSGKNVDAYVVSLEIVTPIYHFQTNISTVNTTISVNKLIAGTAYHVYVTPLYKGVWESFGKTHFSTTGKPIPIVEGLNVTLSKGNVVEVRWQPVRNNPLYLYGVYYGKSKEEISNTGAMVYTNGDRLELHELDACQEYLVDVAVLGGVPTSHPIKVITVMDDRAPPKNVKVEFSRDDEMQVIVTWKAPCSILAYGLQYTITRREVMTGVISQFTYPDELTTDPKIEWRYTADRGGRYELTVQTNVIGSRKSIPVVFDHPAIPFPEEITQCLHCCAVTITFKRPWLPMTDVDPVFLVWLSKDKYFRESTFMFETKKTRFEFNETFIPDGVAEGYFAAVSVQTEHGGKQSPKSPALALQTPSALCRVITSTKDAANLIGLL